MLLTNHTLTGLVIGATLRQPLLIAPVAFASHFILDTTPHYGLKVRPKNVFASKQFQSLAWKDSLLSTLVALSAIYFLPGLFWPLTLGAFFACLPDLFFIPLHFFKFHVSKKLFKFHQRIQWSETPWGIVTEVVWATGMVAILVAQHG